MHAYDVRIKSSNVINNKAGKVSAKIRGSKREIDSKYEILKETLKELRRNSFVTKKKV